MCTKVALERQSLHDIYELREIVPAGNGKWRMAGKGLEEGVEWASKWDGPQHVVFGHDAKRGLQKLPLATGLDSGVCYGFRLSALVVQAERHALQVHALLDLLPADMPRSAYGAFLP